MNNTPQLNDLSKKKFIEQIDCITKLQPSFIQLCTTLRRLIHGLLNEQNEKAYNKPERNYETPLPQHDSTTITFLASIQEKLRQLDIPKRDQEEIITSIEIAALRMQASERQ